MEAILIPAIFIVGLFIAVAFAPRAVYGLSAVVLFIAPQFAIAGLSSTSAWVLSAGLGLLSRGREFLRFKIFPTLLIMMGLQIASVLWSSSSTALIAKVLSTAVVFMMLVGAFVANNDGPRALRATLMVLSPFVIAQAIATIVFRNDPVAEVRYLSSAVANAVIGSAAGDTVSGVLVNNVNSDDKAGGLLFVNGNRASMVMGVCAMIYMMLALMSRNLVALVTSILSGVGVVETGSKTGIALLIGVPIAAMFYASFVRPNAGATRFLTVIAFAVFATVAVLFVFSYAGDYLDRVDESLVPRRALWGAALSGIGQNPLIGLGFGGWERYWPSFAAAAGQPEVFPPHNYLFATGLQNGLPGMAITLVAMVMLLALALRGILTVQSYRGRLVKAFAAFAWIWAYIHGLGDNTDFYGTDQSLPFLVIATVLAWNYNPTDEKPRPTARAYVARPQRLDGTRRTVPTREANAQPGTNPVPTRLRRTGRAW